MNNMRYFLVMGSISTRYNDVRFLNVASIPDGCYLNHKKFKNNIRIAHNCDISEVVITNIIELNESDYNDFIK